MFTKHGGNLGTTGAVAWQFERRGVVLVAADGADEDELVLAAAEAGADDVELDGSSFVVTSAPESLSARARRRSRTAGFAVESVELAMVPKTTVAVADESTARRIVTPRRGARGDRRRPGRLRELRHPRGRARSGSLLGEPVAIVAADTAGRRADRIESLLSARLFVEPQLADDRLTSSRTSPAT